MTTLTKTELINAVLRLMDEHGGNAQFMNGNANNETKRVIEQVTEKAIRDIHLQAPIAMLDAVPLEKPIVDWKNVNGRYACIVELPADFFRLVTCRMQSWARPATLLYWEDSAEYAKQKNTYLMNTWERPAAFLVHRNTKQYAELYSSTSMQDVIDGFLYMPRPEWTGDKIKVADRLKDASLMQVAADTLTVLGETDRAQTMRLMALQPLNTYGGTERNFADNGNRIEK